MRLGRGYLDKKPTPLGRRKVRADPGKRSTRSPKALGPRQRDGILHHELHLHQAELAMQNEELRRTQAALELARDRYRDLYDFAPVGYLTLSADGLIRDANLTGAGLLGVGRARLRGRPFAAFVERDLSDRWLLHLRTLGLARAGEQRACALVLRRGDGSRFHATVTCRRQEAPGDDSAFRVTITEVVEQERADTHALDVARMGALQSAMNLLPIGVILVELDRGGRPWFLSRNSAFDLQLASLQGAGQAADEMAFQIFRPDRKSLVPPAEWPGPRAARTGAAVKDAELHVRFGDGAWRIVSVSAAPIPGRAPEEPRRAFSVVLDITDQVQRDADLRESEERFRAIVERSRDLTLILDGTGTVVFASPASIEMLGRTPSEMVGRTGVDLLHPDDVDAVQASFAEVIADPTRVHPLVLRMRRADGTWVLLEAEARCMLDVPGIRGVVINHRDVTERNRLREQLLESQKLDTIGRVASGVAHDFNNLLTVILSCGEDLQKTLREGSPPDAGCADDIVDAGRRAVELTRQLLVFARKEAVTPVCLDLNKLVRTGEKLLRRAVGDRIAIIDDLAADLWTVRCDPGLVGQLIMNLALNARDAMPGGGSLTLGTENVTVTEGDAGRDPGMAPGRYVKLVVRDTGTGMTPDVLGRIFEPLFTTKVRGKGTGIGLSMVSDIVKQSRAHLAVRSVVGSGTSFEIFFPTDEDES